jgi:hypothetical protein
MPKGGNSISYNEMRIQLPRQGEEEITAVETHKFVAQHSI